MTTNNQRTQRSAEHLRYKQQQYNNAMKRSRASAADDKTEKLLMLAVHRGEFSRVERLLEQGANIHFRNYRKYTALHKACINGHVEIARLLIDNGADIDAKDAYLWTPIRQAAFYQHLKVIQLMVERGADLGAQHPSANNSSAQELYFLSKSEAAKFVIKFGPPRAQFDVVKYLIENDGSDVHAKNSKGWTALHLVCENGYFRLVQPLLNQGANLRVKTDQGETPLHLACGAQDKSRRTLFIGARWCLVVQFLIENGAEIDAKDNNGSTPLHLACFEGSLEVVKLLIKVVIENGAKIDVKDNNGSAPLHLACSQGNWEVAKLLIKVLVENRAQIDVKDNNGQTPLHLACSQGSLEVAKLLIENGSDPNSTSDDGYSPLHQACLGGHLEVAKLLLNRGSNSSLKASSGQGSTTALDLACIQNHHEIVWFLVRQFWLSNL